MHKQLMDLGPDQMAGWVGERTTQKHHGTDGGPRVMREAITALQGRQWAQDAERRAHKPPWHRGKAQGDKRSTHKPPEQRAGSECREKHTQISMKQRAGSGVGPRRSVPGTWVSRTGIRCCGQTGKVEAPSWSRRPRTEDHTDC